MSDYEIQKIAGSQVRQELGYNLFAQSNARDAADVGDDLKTMSEPLFARADIDNEILKWINQLCQDCSGQLIEATEKRKAEASKKLIEISQKSESAKELVVYRLKQTLFTVNKPYEKSKIKLCEYVNVTKLLIRLGYRPNSEEVDKLAVISDTQSGYVDLNIPVVTLIGKADPSGKDKAGKKLDQVFKSGGHPQLRIAAADALINLGKKDETLAYLKEKVLRNIYEGSIMRFETCEYLLKNNLLKKTDMAKIFEKILEGPDDSSFAENDIPYFIKEYKLIIPKPFQEQKKIFDKLKTKLGKNTNKLEAKYIKETEKILIDVLESTYMPFSLTNIRQSIKKYKQRKFDGEITRINNDIGQLSQISKNLLINESESPNFGYPEYSTQSRTAPKNLRKDEKENIDKAILSLQAQKEELKKNKKINFEELYIKIKEAEGAKKRLYGLIKEIEVKIKETESEADLKSLRAAKIEVYKAIEICRDVLNYFNRIKRIWNEVK